jgi:YggT family protein
MLGVIDLVFKIVFLLLIVRCIASWLPPEIQRRGHQVLRLLYEVTDPLLMPFRFAKMRTDAGVIDFSPFLALIVLQFLRTLLFRIF